MKPWNMNGVSVHGRSSSATYMPNSSSSTGTLFFIVGGDAVLRLPYAARRRGPGSALQCRVRPARAGARRRDGPERAAQRRAVAFAAARADRLLAGADAA